MKAIGFTVLIGIVAAIADNHARRAAEQGDTGPFWAHLMERTILVLGTVTLAVIFVPQLLHLGPWHGIDASVLYLVSVAAAWILLVGWSLVRPNPTADPRWLAGTLDFSPRRLWLAIFALPLLFSIVHLWNDWRLPGFAAIWAFLIVVVVNLVGAAWSAHPSQSVSRVSVVAGVAAAPPDLPDWFSGMKALNTKLRLVQSMSPAVHEEPGGSFSWDAVCDRLGSADVSPIMAAAIQSLVDATTEAASQRLVLAPDHSGQLELTALAASEIARRYGQTTIIVTSAPAPDLATEMKKWLARVGGDSPVRFVTVGPGVNTETADLLFTDAETLSEVLLEAYRIQAQSAPAGQLGPASRVGLLVWWDMHAFSGVPAAHLWAISRRLDRFLAEHGAIDRRVLAFARPGRYHQAQYLAFLRRLLPYDWRPGREVEVPAAYARESHIYLLENPTRASLIEAARASSELLAWPTSIPEGLLTTPLTNLQPPRAAGARFMEVQPEDTLNVIDLICRGGRSAPAGLPHHVVLTPGDNPYVAYLLEHVIRTQEAGASVRLAMAEGQADLIGRHLLQALREVPDTFAGLCAGFRWQEEKWRETLEHLADDGLLDRHRVRRLAPGKAHIERDWLYENRQAFRAEPGSFRVIGSEPVEVRDPDSPDGLLFRTARERAAIEAYPYAVLPVRGRRYRVAHWTPNESDQPAKALYCSLEQANVRTYRRRTSGIELGWESDPEPIASPAGVQIELHRVVYSETWRGTVQLELDGQQRLLDSPAGRAPILTEFPTRALVFTFDNRAGNEAARTIAAGLRFLLPVHLAVDDTSLEIVSFLSQGRPSVAIVELFPGGIGLVDGLGQDPIFPQDLLAALANWYRACLSGRRSIEEISRHPLTKATLGVSQLDFQAALNLLATESWQGRYRG